MIANVYVKKVKKDLWSVQLEGNPRIPHYCSQQEANETAVCVALEAVTRSVGTREIDVSDGLSLRVVICSEKKT